MQYIAHFFPLPYHQQAFLAAHGAQIIKQLTKNDSAVFLWADALYGGAQTAFYNAATAGKTYTEVQAQFAALAAATVPGVTAAAFQAGYANDDLNEAARIAWKFSCSRYNTGESAWARYRAAAEAGRTAAGRVKGAWA